jgi:hypothetical protein
MEYLSYWLLFAAALRMLSVGIGLMSPNTFKSKVYRLRPDLVNPLVGRTFASWTLVTCMLCVFCALHLEEPALYSATMASFAVAWLTFVAEFVVFKTVDIKGGLSPMVISTVSLVWMALEKEKHK